MKTRGSTGFTLVELLVVVAIVAIVAAIAVPGLLRARVSGNEASAIGSIRAITSGEAAFSSSCAAGGYAISLGDLVKAPTSGGQPFVSPDLSADNVIKSGYKVAVAAGNGATTVTVAAGTCNGSAADAASSYYSSATPQVFGGTGYRSFASDTRGTIFYTATSAPPPNPIPAASLVAE